MVLQPIFEFDFEIRDLFYQEPTANWDLVTFGTKKNHTRPEENRQPTFYSDEIHSPQGIRVYVFLCETEDRLVSKS